MRASRRARLLRTGAGWTTFSSARSRRCVAARRRGGGRRRADLADVDRPRVPRLSLAPGPAAADREDPAAVARHRLRLPLHRTEAGSDPGGADDLQQPRPARLVSTAANPRRDRPARAALSRPARPDVVAGAADGRDARGRLPPARGT